MKPRVILFFVGLVILIMGTVPLISSVIPAVASFNRGFPLPESQAYLVILVVLGVISLSYGLRGEGKKQLVQTMSH